MLLYSSVTCFVLEFSVRAYKNACHHCKASAGRRNHIAHHVTVIILARPHNAAFVLHYACHAIVNQRIEIFNSGFFKRIFKFCVKNILENRLKVTIIRLANGVFCSEPHRNFLVKRVCKAAARKTFY